MNEQELNKKLAEWAGFVYSSDKEGYWIYPEDVGKKVITRWTHTLPNFTQSLDACFKWLVPKVYDMKISKVNRFEQEWQTAYSARVRKASGYWTETPKDKNPALALCLAIDKLIDEEVNDANQDK